QIRGIRRYHRPVVVDEIGTRGRCRSPLDEEDEALLRIAVLVNGIGEVCGETVPVLGDVQRDLRNDRDEMRTSRLRRRLGGLFHRELLVLRQSWLDDRVDKDRVEVPS